jgi:hypothetical protein
MGLSTCSDEDAEAQGVFTAHTNEYRLQLIKCIYSCGILHMLRSGWGQQILRCGI